MMMMMMMMMMMTTTTTTTTTTMMMMVYLDTIQAILPKQTSLETGSCYCTHLART